MAVFSICEDNELSGKMHVCMQMFPFSEYPSSSRKARCGYHYHFNNMNIPEIAAVMECPEGTVKYRLSVARDKIKSGVMQYEQIHDTKLYSFAGVPILSLLLAEEVKGYQVPQAAEGIVSAIYGITGVGSEAGAKGAGTADGIITKENQAAYTEDMRGYIDDQGDYVNEYFGFTTYYAGQGWDLQLFEEYYYNLYGIEKTFLESIEESTARALYAQHWDDGAMDRGDMYYDCYDLLHDMDEVTPTEEWYQEYMLDTLRKYREQNVTCKYSLYNACIDGIPCYYMECEIHSDPSSGETLYGAPHHLAMIYVFKDNMYLKIDVVPSYCSYNYEEVFGNQLKLLHMSDFAPIDMDDIEKPNEVDQGM